jgi:hypothetical protein
MVNLLFHKNLFGFLVGPKGVNGDFTDNICSVMCNDGYDG